MKNIIIEKIDEEITYQKKTTTHTFKVGDKEVLVYEYADLVDGQEEYDTEIDENDREALTEEEEEVFSDEIYDLMKAKVGKKLKINVPSIEDEE
jgi:hypothetical protein